MTQPAPRVIIVHGEDEYGITQTLASLQAGLGDPSIASMNITRLDGRTASMDDLVNASSSMPFLAAQRLVILTNPLTKLSNKDNKDRFLAFLEKLPSSTLLAVVHLGDLGTWRSKTYYPHWLEAWANDHKETARVRHHRNSPEDMVTKIYAMAKSTGAEINGPAAQELARLVGQDTLLASQEIQKLGASVNYSRPITIEDVRLLVEDTAPANIFSMVDFMSTGKGKEAANLLHKLLEESEPLEIMIMIVRQYRFLLLAREVLDHRGTQYDAVEALNLSKNQTWLAQKYMDQARRFLLADLLEIYHRLLDMDEAMKTGKMEPVLALDLFIASMSSPKAAPGGR